jgi:hypothetical protein
MEKEDLHFYLICPKCYQQDHLRWGNFKHYVLDENPANRLGRIAPARMEGEYLCPYGSKVQMLLFAIGTEKEVDEKSNELYEKYFEKIPKDSCLYQMSGF